MAAASQVVTAKKLLRHTVQIILSSNKLQNRNVTALLSKKKFGFCWIYFTKYVPPPPLSFLFGIENFSKIPPNHRRTKDALRGDLNVIWNRRSEIFCKFIIFVSKNFGIYSISKKISFVGLVNEKKLSFWFNFTK